MGVAPRRQLRAYLVLHSVTDMFELDKKNKERECVKVLLDLCGDARKNVIAVQNKHYEETGRHLAKRQAIYKLLTEK